MTMETEIFTENPSVNTPQVPWSPSTYSEMSTDGDASITQSGTINEKSAGADSEKQDAFEPKAKKRRKQSKPLKCQSLANSAELTVEEVEIPKVEEPEFHHSPDFNASVNEEVEEEEEEKAEDLSSDKPNSNESKMSPENMSQKNILMQMNEMLYGNLLRASTGAQQIGQKNKSSLNLLTDMMSPDSNEDSSRSVMKNAFPTFYPQMPPLLPLTGDLAGELTKLTSVFSQMNELPTQLMQTNLSMTSSNRSFITSNGVRVFNPEAYCELCEKEFCNKYFLKTHKANKHGICSIESPNILSRNQFKPNLPSVVPQTTPQPNENGGQGTPDAYCNICQKSFCNKYFLKKHRQNIHGIAENGTESSPTVPSSIHVPVISSLTSPLSIPESKVDGVSLEQALKKLKSKLNSSLQNGMTVTAAGKQTPILNRNGNEGKNERFLCELCNIEFCDKHYLNTHKQNKHGNDSVQKKGNDFIDFSIIGKSENVEKPNKNCDNTDEFKAQTCIPCMKNFNNTESFYNHMLEAHGAKFKEENGLGKKGDRKLDLQTVKKSSDNEHTNGLGDSTPLYCSLCFLKFKDKAALFAHFEASHSMPDSSGHLNGSVGSSPNSNVQCDACTEQFSDTQVLMSHRLKVHGIISPMTADIQLNHAEDKAFDMDLTGLPINKTSHGSFCQICHQELYNKYFMKTHMLKMHGIDVDALPNEKVTKVDKNLPCDICHKVFGGKTILKAHKLHVHGITEDISPLNSVKTEIGSDDHSDSENKKANPMSEVSNEFSKEENTKIFICEICSQEFPSKLLLQVHLVNKHVNNGESQVTNLRGLIGLSMSKTDGFSKDFNASLEELGKSDKSCACCTLVTKEGKPKVFGSTESTLLCHICNVYYPSSNRYHHHLAHINLMVCETNAASKKVNHVKENNNDLPVSSMENNHNSNKNRSKSRKLKRFRCSKCDKTFRTRNKCLHHIQIVHKSKKGMSNHVDHSNEANNLMSNIDSADPPLITSNCITEMEDDKKGLRPSVPYILPESSRDVLMQAFHLSEPKTDGLSKPDVFVPSLVYLPVSRRVSGPVTVAFTLTPA